MGYCAPWLLVCDLRMSRNLGQMAKVLSCLENRRSRRRKRTCQGELYQGQSSKGLFFTAGSVGNKLPSAYVQDVISQSVHLCSTPPHTHTADFFTLLSSPARQVKKGNVHSGVTPLFATASLAFNCFALLGKGQELSGRKRPSDQTWDACREDMVSVHKLMFLSRRSSFLLLWEMMKFAFCRSSLLSQWIQWNLYPPDAKACALLHHIRPA